MNEQDPAPRRPTICLSMIVRDEAHIVVETLDAVAPHIDYWVIVDTGSADDTIATIRSAMDAKGVPGELHERSWRNFGANRTEALELCAGKGDYAWVIDADDLVVGELDLTELSADSYLVRYGGDFRYWRKQIFRDGLRWRFEGSVHEFALCLDPASEARLDGDYYVESRRLGARNRDPRKYERDRRLLEAELERDPDDPRTVFYLAQSLFDAGEHRLALERYTQRAGMGGWEEEVFFSRLRRGQCLDETGEQWGLVLEAYLECWQGRPSRAEPLYEIARHYRVAGEYRLGYLFACEASRIPFPDDEVLFISADVYEWRARDELAVCAYYVDHPEESFEVASSLLEDPELPASERERVQGNRDLCIPSLAEERARYPAALVGEIVARLEDRTELPPTLTLTITSCRRPVLFERTVNSFLNCCTDLERIDRWVCVDNGSTATDRARMAERYPFFEFVVTEPDEGEGHVDSMNRILGLVKTTWWLHLEDDWLFFWRGQYIGRALEIMGDEPGVGQVSFNVNYGETPESARWIIGGVPRRSIGDAFPYRVHQHLDPESKEWEQHFKALSPGSQTAAYWPHFTLRPSLIRRDAVAAIGEFEGSAGHFELDFARRYAAAGHLTAFFDQVVCLHTGRLTDEDAPGPRLSAYELVGEGTHPAHPRRTAEAAEPMEVEALVINLDRRPDRWEAFRRMAEHAAGPAFLASCSRVAGVDGTTLEAEPEVRHTFRGNDFSFRRGLIGCALSHIGIWEAPAKDSGAVRLILEDDVLLAEDFRRRLSTVLGQVVDERPDFELLLLGRSGVEEDATANAAGDRSPHAYRAMDWRGYRGGAFAYVVSAAGALKLLDLVRRDGVQNGIDTFLMVKRDELIVLECDPPLATAHVADPGNQVDSDIQRDFEPVRFDSEAENADADRAPRRLAEIAASCRVGELQLDAPPGWRCTLAGVAATGDGFEVRARLEPETSSVDGDPLEYLVTLDDALGVRNVEILDGGSTPLAPDGPPDLEVAIGEDVLQLRIESAENVSPGAHRFVRVDAIGRPIAGSEAFTIAGADGESCSGVAERDGEMVIAFAASERSWIAALELDEILTALQPWT